MTKALGGVENGDAKHILAPSVTPNKTDKDSVPSQSLTKARSEP